MTLPHLKTSFQLSLRAALAGGIAVVIAGLLQLQFPIYAMISAVLVTDLVPAVSRKLALPRLAGTALGTALGVAISATLPAGMWTLVFGVFAGMFLTHLLRLQDAAKLAGYVCGIVLLDHGAQPLYYALYRMAETTLGIGAALLMSVVPMLMPGDAADAQDASKSQDAPGPKGDDGG